ncbi:hypothetical protein STEG23_029441 [Scotinomys teguina]
MRAGQLAPPLAACYIGKYTATLGNFAKATLDVISKTYSDLTPDLWEGTFTKSPHQKFTGHLVKTHTRDSVQRTQVPGFLYKKTEFQKATNNKKQFLRLPASKNSSQKVLKTETQVINAMQVADALRSTSFVPKQSHRKIWARTQRKMTNELCKIKGSFMFLLRRRNCQTFYKTQREVILCSSVVFGAVED